MERIIKNFLIIIFAFFAASMPVFAQKTDRLAVFPVDVHVEGTSYGLYPNVLDLISGDIVNSLTKQALVGVVDLNSSQNKLKAAKLHKKYLEMLLNYKNSYTLDNETLTKVGKKLGVNKVLLVSGGFDVQKLIMKRGWLYAFNLPNSKPLSPSYRLNITISLFSVQDGLLIWEETYKRDFSADDFNLASQYFAENVVSVEKIKKFSIETSDKVALQFAQMYQLPLTAIPVSVPVRIPEENKNQQPLTKDGTMTKDGLPSSGDYALNKRKTEYKKWVTQNLPKKAAKAKPKTKSKPKSPVKKTLKPAVHKTTPRLKSKIQLKK